MFTHPLSWPGCKSNSMTHMWNLVPTEFVLHFYLPSGNLQCTLHGLEALYNIIYFVYCMRYVCIALYTQPATGAGPCPLYCVMYQPEYIGYCDLPYICMSCSIVSVCVHACVCLLSPCPPQSPVWETGTARSWQPAQPGCLGRFAGGTWSETVWRHNLGTVIHNIYYTYCMYVSLASASIHSFGDACGGHIDYCKICMLRSWPN